jgi:hypothetical protein
VYSIGPFALCVVPVAGPGLLMIPRINNTSGPAYRIAPGRDWGIEIVAYPEALG